MNLKDIGVRAVKTALQVALGFPVVDMAFGLDLSGLQAAALAGAAAGVSVVMNAVRDWANS